MRGFLVVLALTGVLAPCATAQDRLAEPIIVEPGHRVRVTLASRIAPGPLIGTAFFIDPDSLVVQRGNASRVVRRVQASKIEVSTAREYRPGEAALSGFLVTSPFTAISVAFFLLGPSDVSTWAGSLALLSGGGGALAGFLIGGTTPQDVWVQARWEAARTAKPGDVDSRMEPR